MAVQFFFTNLNKYIKAYGAAPTGQYSKELSQKAAEIL